MPPLSWRLRRRLLLPLAPRRFPYLRFAGALLIGSLGGLLFLSQRLPLPWMLGSMTACTLAALARVPVAAPRIVRPPMSAVIGVMLGAGFSPGVVGTLPGWLPALGGLLLFTAVSGLACITYFRRVAGFDPVTAYFAGMPGGLVEMVLVGEQRGGDGRTIALVHSARILMLVFVLPFLVGYLSGAPLGARVQAGASLLSTPWMADLWLVLVGLAGAVTGRRLRLPAPYLTGPMLLSALVHVTGLSDFQPPFEVVNAAQLVLGTVIGCSFAGVAPREVLRILRLSLGSTAILVAVTVLFAFGMSRVAPQGPIPLILAYSPGGLAEMSLIALALGVEVAFVAFHHIARVVFVVFAASLVFRWIGPRLARGGADGSGG